MSEQHTETNPGNGASAPAGQRKSVARVSINGTIAQARFSEHYENQIVEVDVGGLLPEGTPASVAALAAFGAMNAIKAALRAEDPVNAARTVARKITDGSWNPAGNGRTKAAAEPGVFELALVEHLHRLPERANFGVGDVPQWLAEQALKYGWRDSHGQPAITRVKRHLESNAALAPIIARLQAERARAVAHAARRQPTEDLT